MALSEEEKAEILAIKCRKPSPLEEAIEALEYYGHPENYKERHILGILQEQGAKARKAWERLTGRKFGA